MLVSVIFLFLLSIVQCQQQINNRIVEKTATCDDNFLYFTVLFERPFAGIIYSDGEYANQRCTYVNGTTFSSIRYNVTIPLTDCRSQRFQNGTRMNAIIVQKDARVLESTDNMFILSCTPGGFSNFAGGYGPNQRFTLTFLGITVQGVLASTEVVTNVVTSPLDYTVEVQLGQGPNGRPVDRILNVGEPISYVVRLRNLRQDTDIKVGRCWASDGASDIQLSDDDGCSLQPNNNIWNTFRSSQLENGGRLLYNNIKTWAFPTSNRVNILCNLHVCASICSQTTCLSTTSKAPRKWSIRNRRDFDTDNSTTIKIQSGYRVVAFNKASSIVADNDINFAESKRSNLSSHFNHLSTMDDDVSSLALTNVERKICLSRTVFIAAVVLLLIIIVLTFTFVIFTLVYLYRTSRRRRSERHHFRHGHFNVALCESDGLKN